MRIVIRWCAVVGLLVVFSGGASARKPKAEAPLPTEFEIARHTFFDFGPPNDYYELFFVRSAAKGTSIERIILTPAADQCTMPAKLETASASIAETVPELLGRSNPCQIPEKDLHRELKRCKKCLVFSGANVSMQVQCGTQRRVIRADILDKDWFDPAANTPEHTSWTMHLLGRLDEAIGPGVMDKPMFARPEENTTQPLRESLAVQQIGSGEYDLLFQGAPDKPSELYKASQVKLPQPGVRLVSSTPFTPLEFVAPKYPAIARVAHVEGQVVLNAMIDSQGAVGDITVVNGPPLLRNAAIEAVKKSKFSTEAGNRQVRAVMEFQMNCVHKTD